MAAAVSTFLPVAMSPVIETIEIFGWLISALPTVSPRPVTTLTTPSGRMSASRRASFSAVKGVCSDGLKTTVLPPAIAGASFHAIIISG
ncbi:hypothetical protein D3C86_1821340 [compost metagenome]